MNLSRITSELLNPHERRKGQRGNRAPLRADILDSQRYWRKYSKEQHQMCREISKRPVLGQLRMNESAIAMGLQMQATLNAWRGIA